MEVCYDEFEDKDLVFRMDIDGDIAVVVFDETEAIEAEGNVNRELSTISKTE
jgi:hypothetical protein